MNKSLKFTLVVTLIILVPLILLALFYEKSETGESTVSAQQATHSAK